MSKNVMKINTIMSDMMIGLDRKSIGGDEGN